MTTYADTSDDINDVLGVIVEDVSTFTRHAAIRAAKAARCVWTLGQIALGGDLAKRKARARRVRIKRERATEKRRQAQEITRLERERARTEAAQRARGRSTNAPATDPGSVPSPESRVQSETPPKRAGARTGVRPTNPKETRMDAEPSTYEGALALLDQIKDTAETLATSAENAGATLAATGLKDGAITNFGQIIEGAQLAATAAEKIRGDLVSEQGPIWEAAQAGRVAHREFYG